MSVCQVSIEMACVRMTGQHRDVICVSGQHRDGICPCVRSA